MAVPEGKQIDRLELFLNETRVATLFGPPYVQVVDVPLPKRGHDGSPRIWGWAKPRAYAESTREVRKCPGRWTSTREGGQRTERTSRTRDGQDVRRIRHRGAV